MVVVEADQVARLRDRLARERRCQGDLGGERRTDRLAAAPVDAEVLFRSADRFISNARGL